ncbi:hypothetical protein LCGC14_1061010 [marine sediment metagenome]|uniref:Uncharacterized protein n=1 Tax=marine sediment metagenome TaxID=412755 RepID=A0A0F9QRZ6_9ZZZZ
MKIHLLTPNPLHRDVLGNDPRISWSFDEWFSRMELNDEWVRALFLHEGLPGQADLLLKHFCVLAWLHAQGRIRFEDIERKAGEPISPVVRR